MKIQQLRDLIDEAFHDVDVMPLARGEWILNTDDGSSGVDLKLTTDCLRIIGFMRDPYHVTRDEWINITPAQYIKLRDHIKEHVA